MRRKLILEVGPPACPCARPAPARAHTQLRDKLRQVIDMSKADDPSVAEYLCKLRAELVGALERTLQMENESKVPEALQSDVADIDSSTRFS